MIYLEATANSYLGIKCARAKFTLAGTAAEEYPTLPTFTPERIVTIQAIVLSQMIEQTMYAASVDETRYNLNGVYLEVIDGERSDHSEEGTRRAEATRRRRRC
jgi:DNA polymerase-3 subunit beta